MATTKVVGSGMEGLHEDVDNNDNQRYEGMRSWVCGEKGVRMGKSRWWYDSKQLIEDLEASQVKWAMIEEAEDEKGKGVERRINLEAVESEEQVADALTKGLNGVKLLKHSTSMGMANYDIETGC
ncbi:hypothetical protein E3N88_36854 [Mikania micrantha]|uniref:Uncharacterized protein n=1 Tax=Mikania micrantha TaxID=192012 RepID=A0A5N6M4T9_9ASTR|nr:hypothetical protein E3N88_36854 [Mikania micrantha]